MTYYAATILEVTMKKLVAILAASLVPALAGAAYPERPVKLIVPWGAGGDTDVIYRTFGPLMEKYLGGTIVVANVAALPAPKARRRPRARRRTATPSSPSTTRSTPRTTRAWRT